MNTKSDLSIRDLAYAKAIKLHATALFCHSTEDNVKFCLHDLVPTCSMQLGFCIPALLLHEHLVDLMYNAIQEQGVHTNCVQGLVHLPFICP